MAKKTEEKIFSKDVDTENLNKIREATKTIRKYSFVNENLFKTFKTTKKEALLKEVASLSELINKL